MKIPSGYFVGSTIDKNAADLDADFLISAHFEGNPLIALWTKEDDMFFRQDLYKLRNDILGKRDARCRVNLNMPVDEYGNVLKHDDEDYLFEENASTIAEDYHPSKDVISDYRGYSEYHFELDYDEDPIVIFEYTGEHHVNIDNPLKHNLESNYVFHRYDYFFYFVTLFFIFYNDFFISGYLYIMFGHVMAFYFFEVDDDEEEIELEDEIALEEYTIKAFYLIESYALVPVESYYNKK